MAWRLCFTVMAAFAGALAGKKVKLPAPFMTGSMVAVILMNFFTEMAYCPVVAKPYVQVVAGAFIAMGITRRTVGEMKRIVKPLLAYLCCLAVWALFCGYLMHVLGRLELVTAFLSCVPGGLTDISLISVDMGANTPQVTTLQTLRMIMAVAVFPLLTRLFVTRFGHIFQLENRRPAIPDGKERVLECERRTWKNALISLAVAIAGGRLGAAAGFPSATLTGAMIAAAAWNVVSGRTYIPTKLRKLTQLVAGCMVGSMVSRADIYGLVVMSVPFFIILAEYLLFNFLAAPLLSKAFQMDLLTMILACTPAGASDMALIAGDMGGDMSEVAVFHVVRLCMVLTLFPTMIQWIADYF